MNHERDRREYNRKLAIEMNKSGGAVFGRNEIPGEYSILNGSMVFRKKGSNDPWIEWKGTYDHLAPGRTPHGKLPADQYSVGTSNKVTLGGKTYDLSIPAHLKLYQEAGGNTATLSDSKPTSSPTKDTSGYKPDAATNPLKWLEQWAKGAIQRNSTGVKGAVAMTSGQDPTEQNVPGAKPQPQKPTKPEKPTKPANKDKPLPYGSLPGGDNPDRSAAQPGTGPKGNEVGSDSDPDEPGLQGPGDPKGPPGSSRVNANGLVSYGKDLSSLNAFTSAFTGGYELTDIKSAFQSNDLQGAYQNGSNKISTEDSKYTLNDSATPSNVGGKYTMDGVDTSLQNTGYKIDGGSVPGTVGSNPANPQDGTSDKPDVAESIRTVRMERQSGRGSRRDPRNRGEDPDMFGGPEPSDASLVSPMYANKKRNAIRDAFFAGETSVKGAVAANAVAGYGKDSNADARFNVGGELVYAKDGMQQKAKNAAMMGQDPTQFLDIPTTPDTQPDTPAASELSPTPKSAVAPGSITMPENKGGSLETQAPITKPSPEKFKEAQDFLTSNIDWLNRKTK